LQVPLTDRYGEAFFELSGKRRVDIRLVTTKLIALINTAARCLNAAQTTPARPMAGLEAPHLLARVMNAATVAKKGLGHDQYSPEIQSSMIMACVFYREMTDMLRLEIIAQARRSMKQHWTPAYARVTT
jgi:hypothetical protein